MSDKYKKTVSFMNEIGFSVVEFIRELGENNSAFFSLCDEAQQKFDEMYNQLKSNEANFDSKFNSQKDKGNALEELVNSMFVTGTNPLFEIKRNCRTSTNELDLLIDWSEFARKTLVSTMYDELKEGFICECKYYNEKVSVTYIGKFYSLLKTTDMKIGLFLTWNGVTGRGAWRDSKGLIKKIALKDGIYILDFEESDYMKINNKEENIFSLIHKKYFCLKNDINFNNYIKQHENEGKIL